MWRVCPCETVFRLRRKLMRKETHGIFEYFLTSVLLSYGFCPCAGLFKKILCIQCVCFVPVWKGWLWALIVNSHLKLSCLCISTSWWIYSICTVHMSVMNQSLQKHFSLEFKAIVKCTCTQWHVTFVQPTLIKSCYACPPSARLVVRFCCIGQQVGMPPLGVWRSLSDWARQSNIKMI